MNSNEAPHITLTPEQRELLQNWRGTTAMIASQHFRSASLARRRHIRLNCAVTVFSTLAGSSVAAGFLTGSAVAQVAGLSINLLAALTSAVQLKSDHFEQIERFRIAAAKAAALNREINQFIAFLPHTVSELESRVTEIRIKWDEISKDSLLLYDSTLTKSQRGIGRAPELKPRIPDTPPKRSITPSPDDKINVN